MYAFAFDNQKKKELSTDRIQYAYKKTHVRMTIYIDHQRFLFIALLNM